MKNQFGRSMIEILGVLAIIGVLSIGGVATFQYAMTKDKANKVIYDINLLREQTLTNAADVPAENFEPESGYQMSSQYGEGGIVSIMIDDLDQDVCERLLSMRFEDLRFLNAEQNTDILSCEGTPSFRAVFGLGDNAIIDEDACVIPCDSNHECHERRCCPKLADGICSATASGCPTQVADDGTPCGTNQVCDDGECVCGLECGGEFVPNSACDACECGLECDNGGTPNESCTACENCANSYGGTYCDVCEQNCQNSGTPIQNCSACDCANSWAGDNCETCDLTCQNGGTANEDCSACDCPSNRTGDNCETCAGNWTGDNCDVCELSEEDCPIGFKINQDTCSYECSLTTYDCGSSQNIDSEHCLCVCENEGYTGYSCSYSCPNKGACVSGISKSACEACGNAFWHEGACCHCNRSVGVLFNTEAEAAECMNTCAGSGYERYNGGKYCYPATGTTCPTATSLTSKMSKSVCEECGDAFWDDGYCYGCGYSSGVSYSTEAEAEECMNACAGSGYERYQDGKGCHLATNTTCPSATSTTSKMSKSACEKCDNTFWKDGGNCYGCGYTSRVPFDTEAEAKACESACKGSGYERYQRGNSCELVTNTTCPSARSSTYYMSKSACEACGNAFWDDGYCYGCGYSSGVFYSTEAEAAECENICAGSGYNRIAEEKYCHIPTNTTCPSATSRTSNVSKSACEACGNAFWKNGDCYGCGYSSSVSFDTVAEAESCVNACADRGYERYQEGVSCSLPTNTTCPSATTSKSGTSKSVCEACANAFWKNGTCYGCGYSSNMSFETEEEAKDCENACAGSSYGRYQIGIVCYRATNTTCPSATSTTSKMSKSACEKCDNTFWKNGTCYGCGYSSAGVSYSTEAEAEACVNACVGSGYNRIAEGTYCHIPTDTTCPYEASSRGNVSKSVCEACGNTFWYNGTCYDCGFVSNASFNTEADAEACVNSCAGTGYERYKSGMSCYRAPNTTCPSATSHTYYMSKSACEACVEKDGIPRIWSDSDGLCLGCGASRTASFNNEAEAEACVAACADTRYPREIDKSGDVYYCDLK